MKEHLLGVYERGKESAWIQARAVLQGRNVSEQTWRRIEEAPKDGTEILLTSFHNSHGRSYGETDFGAWGVIEKVPYEEGGPKNIYGWLSNFGRIDEPTHFMKVRDPS